MTARKLTEPMKEAIRHAWREGADPIDLQIEYDIANSTLYRVVKGVPNGRGSSPGRYRTFDYAKAKEMKARGLKAGVIAKRFGVTEGTIFAALRQLRKAT